MQETNERAAVLLGTIQHLHNAGVTVAMPWVGSCIEDDLCNRDVDY